MTQRKSSSSTPAAGPIAARVGSNAVASIAAVISATDSSSMVRRPLRSPMWPKAIAPSGRIR